jgi:hypothetical protein
MKRSLTTEPVQAQTNKEYLMDAASVPLFYLLDPGFLLFLLVGGVGYGLIKLLWWLYGWFSDWRASR